MLQNTAVPLWEYNPNSFRQAIAATEQYPNTSDGVLWGGFDHHSLMMWTRLHQALLVSQRLHPLQGWIPHRKGCALHVPGTRGCRTDKAATMVIACQMPPQALEARQPWVLGYERS